MSHDTFEAFLRELGLRPRVVAPDERIRRCTTDSHTRKRNGAYWLSVDGAFGWAQDWAVHTEPVKWFASGDEIRAPKFDPEQHRRMWEERERERKEASREAREFYAACSPLRDGHPYLEAHHLGVPCSGLRVDDEGWLVVPMQRVLRGTDGPATLRVVTVQRISPKGEKRFWPKAPATGASFMATRQRASMTVLSEGVATGFALYVSIPPSRVLIAFSARNMYHQHVLDRIPSGETVVAADNDHETEERTGTNPGVEAGEKAAGLLGVGLAVPDCEGTDWSDFRQERFAYHKERLLPWERDSTALRRAEADVRRAVMPCAEMRR